MQSYCNADNFGEDFIYCSMSIDHAKLKAIALLKLDSFVKAFTEINKQKILGNERIDMSEILKMDGYTEFNQAVADLNKYLTVTSTPKKVERIHKA